MATTNKVLKLKFKTEEDKTRSISVKFPKENLDAETVRKAMEAVVASDAFEKDGVKLYTKTAGAYYYTTSQEDIFDEEEDTASENAE